MHFQLFALIDLKSLSSFLFLILVLVAVYTAEINLSFPCSVLLFGWITVLLLMKYCYRKNKEDYFDFSVPVILSNETSIWMVPPQIYWSCNVLSCIILIRFHRVLTKGFLIVLLSTNLISRWSKITPIRHDTQLIMNPYCINLIFFHNSSRGFTFKEQSLFS